MIETIRGEQALKLCTLAQGDLSALQYPLPDAIYGFCAQQACEKLCKALISAHGKPYPLTHNLDRLTTLLQSYGEQLPQLPFDLLLLQPYAVQFRYDEGASLDEEERPTMRQAVADFQHFIVTRILELEATQS